MNNSGEKPHAAIAVDSRLSKEAGYSDDSPAKPISRKKKNSRKRRHGESTSSRYKIMINHVGMLKEFPHKQNGNEYCVPHKEFRTIYMFGIICGRI